MLITIKYFGLLVEITKINQETIEISPTTTIDQLNDIVVSKYPAIKETTYNIAVNQKIVDTKLIVKNGDELAFLPPFAGG